MGFSAVAVIPVYNHPSTVGGVLEGVLHANLPCILVDDGSSDGCARVLDALQACHAPMVQLVRLEKNQGKGAAVMAGLRAAQDRGFTHAVQIDADGQHAVGDIGRFVQAAKACPEAVVCGVPIYDASVPKGRLYGRYLTHVWVWINTLSLDIRDSMCGFRVYPLAQTVGVLNSAQLGRRMEFDSEVLVRLHWRGVPFVCLPTRVTYPQDGLSHFKVWRDNVLISGMHARMFFGMLWRLPRLLRRNLCVARGVAP